MSLSTRAHAAVGRLLFTFSRLDVNLALYVANYKGTQAHDRVILELEATSFKDKLSLVLPSIDRWYKDRKECREDWEQWLLHADQLRLQRNDLIHGRWGFNESQQYVVNVVGLPGSPNQRENRYTASELEAEADQAEHLAREFYKLTAKWPA